LDPLALRAAYTAGVTPAEVVGAAYDRLDTAADPAIFISALTRREALERAAALPPFDPERFSPLGRALRGQGQHRRRGLRDDGGLPRLRLRPRAPLPSRGTDTAGSGGVPAALNNVVGLKPSLGAAPEP
jgi:allophanate hydrolase